MGSESNDLDHCEKPERGCEVPGSCSCNCLRCQVQRGNETEEERAAREAYWNPILAAHKGRHPGRPLDFSCGCIPKEVEEDWERRQRENQK